MKVNASQSSFGTLLGRINNPFNSLGAKERYVLNDWVSELPVTSNVSVLSEHVLSLIMYDYKENSVDLVEGIILSKTEIMLYLAKEIRV